MLLKTIEIDGKTYAEIQDGKPVYVSDGKELALDVPDMAAKITRLNHEAMSKRKDIEALQSQVKAFEGIDDPAAALKAMAAMKNLDDKKLVDAGEVEKVKAEAIKAVEEKYRPTVEKVEALERQLRQEKIGGSFARSKYIADALAVPVQMVEATFGSSFAVEDGRIVAKDASGNQIYSKARPGEAADFDEALEILVGQSPYRDSILKGRGHNGSGAPGGGGAKGAKTMTRTEYEKMARENPAAARQALVKDGVTLTD